MSLERTQDVARAVTAGVRRWLGLRPPVETLPDFSPNDDVIHAMPRRRLTHVVDTSHVTVPMARKPEFNPGIVRPIGRLLVWLRACIRFFGGNLIDRVRGRASVERRAVRLRTVFEDAGASFLKLGQQLSLRADLLPYAYCAELSKMLDQARPFPTHEAIAIIERNLRRPLREIFKSFDPEPIGSASLACVYQAVLRSGQQVAVKVQRPDIALTIAADLRALDWLLIVAEGLTILRAGFTKSFREDLRRILMGELNFRAEARYTEMFRRRSKKNGGYITAPRVYFQYCTQEVMVSEFVTGIWMWELIGAVDRDDRALLAQWAAIGIEPKALAERLVHVLHRELLEELFFHADPHPANMVVLPDNRVCFIDFGAIGRFSTHTRNAWRELHYHMTQEDIGRMVNASMGLVGPLPPVDVDKFIKALEEIYTDWVYSVVSTDAEWWERSTAQAWIRYINVARELGVSVSLETMQFFRATLLHASIVTRLDNTINFKREWQNYARKAGKNARRRVQKSIRKRLDGPTNTDYLRIEQLVDMVTQVVFRWQRIIEEPILQFRSVVGKIAYGVSMLLRLAYLGAAAVVLFLVAQFVSEVWFGEPIHWSAIAAWIGTLGWIQVLLLVAGLVVIRRVLNRMNEPDHKPDNE